MIERSDVLSKIVSVVSSDETFTDDMPVSSILKFRLWFPSSSLSSITKNIMHSLVGIGEFAEKFGFSIGSMSSAAVN